MGIAALSYAHAQHVTFIPVPHSPAWPRRAGCRGLADGDGLPNIADEDWDGDPLNPPEAQRKHTLLKTFNTPNVDTEVSGNTIRGMAVLKEGSETENWGWKHIVTREHNDDVMTAFGLPDNDESVKQFIGRGLKEGRLEIDPTGTPIIRWQPEGSKYELVIVMAHDWSGSITTIRPEEVL